jgi:hypothetical protein
MGFTFLAKNSTGICRSGNSGRRLRFRRGGAGARPVRAVADPRAETRDHVRRERIIVLGHAMVQIATREPLDNQAGCGLTGHDGRTALAACKDCVSVVKMEVTGESFSRRVARVATLAQNGTNYHFKKFRLFSRGNGEGG